MSKYTTEVRFICETFAGYDSSQGGNSVDEVVSKARDKVFNFNYPIFDENYKEVLETKILKHYYTREIGEETVGLWQLRLNTRLNEIMPYYNKLYQSEMIEFDPMNTNVIEKTGGRKEKEDVSNVTGNSSNSGSTSYDKYSDTPQGGLSGIDSDTYLTNARKVTNSTNNASNTDFNGGRNYEDEYFENIKGYNGISSELLMKYRETFLNIDVQIINELKDLFINLW